DLADLAVGDRIVAAGGDDLDDDALVDDETFACLGLVGDQAEVGRAIALERRDAALLEPAAERRGHRLAAQARARERRQRDAGFVGLFEEDAKKARRSR